MSVEKIIHGYQRTLRLPTAPRRPATVGILIDTRGVIPVEHAANPQLVLGQEGIGRYERMSHARGMEYWRKAYETEIASRKLDPQAEWRKHSDTYFQMLKGIKNDLKRIKEGDVRREEQFYNDPEFFKEILFSKKIRSDEVHRYGLIALSIETTDPVRAKLFENYGFALLEKAEEMDPRNIRFKLALWKEHDRKRREKAEKRKQERKKEEKQERKKSSKPKLINRYNTPELEEQFTVPYYAERIQFWTDDLEKITEGKEIDYGKLRKEHSKNVRAAKKARDGRNYDKRKRKYEPQFYDELLNSENLGAISAYLGGLNALYTAPAGKEPECDRKGFKLLEKAAELPPPPHDPRTSLPWPIFIRWAIIQEYLEKKAHVEPRSHTESKVLTDMLGRVRGKETEKLNDRKRPGNISQEVLPF